MRADSTSQNRPRSRAEDELNAFIDAIVGGRAPKNDGVDPALASTVRHLHRRSATRSDQRLKREIWASIASQATPTPLPIVPSRPTHTRRPMSRRVADPQGMRIRTRPPRARRTDHGAFVTAAFLMIIVLVAGGLFMLDRAETQNPASLPAGQVATPAPSTLYIGHFARLTAEIPGSWTVDPSGIFDYAGPDGFVASEPVVGRTLDDACATVAESMDDGPPATVSTTNWSGRVVCRIEGRLRGVDVAAIVVPHSYPFSSEDQFYSFAAVIADPQHVGTIASTIDFSPEQVTPEAYAISLLDLVETRSLWSHQIHWPTVRQQVLDYIDGLDTIEMARQGIFNLINQNLRLTDDDRSAAVAPNRQTEREGFGALVAEKQVVLIYPGSPAEQAGIRVGDRIEAANGIPIIATTLLADASMVLPGGLLPLDPFTVTLTLLRPGTVSPIDVSITSSPLDQSPLPTGTRIAGDIGLLTLPGGTLAAHEDDYVSTAHHTMAQLDAAPACGWIVDLRLASTTSYPPILASVGPFLGDDVIAGWRGRDGGQSWVAYADGVVTEDGYTSAEYTGAQTSTLRQPGAPVAVLIGPYTLRGGEVAALALAGRPDTRLFGERTRGDTALSRTYPLFDGSTLYLAEAMLTDKSGAEYPDGIQPDEEIPNMWATYGMDTDPAVAAAREWLAQQPACTAVPEES